MQKTDYKKLDDAIVARLHTGPRFLLTIYDGDVRREAAAQQPAPVPVSAKPLTKWMPIETAPKDGSEVDIWCVVPSDSDFVHSAGGIRLTASWHLANKTFPHTGWVRVTDDGNFDLIDSPPIAPLGLPRWAPTHWMPLPPPPAKP